MLDAFYVRTNIWTNKENKMDKEIVDRLRNENPEQFQTLVRMHLSFELDLNTDPVEWVFNEAKIHFFFATLLYMFHIVEHVFSHCTYFLFCFSWFHLF